MRSSFAVCIRTDNRTREADPQLVADVMPLHNLQDTLCEDVFYIWLFPLSPVVNNLLGRTSGPITF